MVRLHVTPEDSAGYHAFTADISRHGALILSRQPLEPGREVRVTNLEHGVSQFFRVVRRGAEFWGNHCIGLELLRPFPDFWGAAYRPR